MAVSRSIIVSTFILATTCSVLGRTPPSTSIKARATWTSLGCYTDNVSGRALPHSVAVPGGTNSMTNEACQSACQSAGFSIAGTEYAGECCKSVLEWS